MPSALPALDQQHANGPHPEVSIVVPAWNESGTLVDLSERIRRVLEASNTAYELIVVDDGSDDDSEVVLRRLQRQDPRIQPLFLGKHEGKSAALQAGFEVTRGLWVVSMDADLQDLPEELPRLLEALQRDGVDMVQAWRKTRKDSWSKVLASRVFNLLSWFLSGVKMRDANCGFKAFRRGSLEYLQLGPGEHRFVPVLATRAGLHVIEVPVRHARRACGSSRYGLERCSKGLRDLIRVVLLPRLTGKM